MTLKGLQIFQLPCDSTHRAICIQSRGEQKFKYGHVSRRQDNAQIAHAMFACRSIAY